MLKMNELERKQLMKERDNIEEEFNEVSREYYQKLKFIENEKNELEKEEHSFS